MVTLTTDIYNNYEIECNAGDNVYFKDTITDVNGTAVNISGSGGSIEFKKPNAYLRKYIDSTDLAICTCTLLNQTTYTGQYVVNITPTQTSTTLGRGTFLLVLKFVYNDTEISYKIVRLTIV